METEKTKRKFTKVPAPVCALGLGLACLASATGGFAAFLAIPALAIWSYVLAVGAIIPLALYLLKIAFNFPAFKQDLKHPVFTSIIPAFAMAVMILSHFLGLIDTMSGIVLWFIGIGLHVVFTITFLFSVIKGFKWENFIPAYYVAPVGIVVGVVCGAGFAPTLGVTFSTLNLFIFWYGLFWYIGLLPDMIARLAQKTIPEPKKPTIIIMNAPPNLLVAGYMTLSLPPFNYITVEPVLALMLVILSLVTTVYVYIMLFKKLLWMKFNPGFAAYTFPTVIAGVGMLKYGVYLGLQGNPLHILFKELAVIEFIASTIIVLYVAVSFLYFLVIKPKIGAK